MQLLVQVVGAQCVLKVMNTQLSAQACNYSSQQHWLVHPTLKTTAFAPTKSNRCTVLRSVSATPRSRSSSGAARAGQTGRVSGGGCANWQLSPCRHTPLRCQCRQMGFSFGGAISTARRSQPREPDCITALLRIFSNRYHAKSSVLVTVFPSGQSGQLGV